MLNLSLKATDFGWMEIFTYQARDFLSIKEGVNSRNETFGSKIVGSGIFLLKYGNLNMGQPPMHKYAAS